MVRVTANHFKIHVVTAIFICLISYKSLAQEIQKPESSDSLNRTVTFEKPKFTPYIAPVASPEVDFMLVAGGLFTFNVDPKDSLLPRSSIPFSIGYSTNGSFNSNFRPFIYGKKDKYRFFGDLTIKNMPDNYWGVGYDNGKNVEKSDSTTAYHRVWWQIYFNLVRKIKPNFYAGINLDINHTNASQLNPRMMEDPHVVNQGTSFNNSGFGLILQYDSRDFAVNAYSGLYLSLTASFYRKFFGANTNFNGYLLDYRQYKQISRPGRTLAWQVKSRLLTDGVPWTDMALLGTPFDLRGYIQGRYRDQTTTFGLLEYRHMFMRKKPNKKGSYRSRSGIVIWIATGAINDTIGKKINWLPNAGIGYRLEIQERMNVRIDYGRGEDSDGIYVSFSEAF